MKPLRLWLSIALMTPLLGACKTVPSEPLIVTTCPPLAKYDKEMQKRTAQELKALPPGSSLPKYMNDYSKLRDACRKIKR